MIEIDSTHPSSIPAYPLTGCSELGAYPRTQGRVQGKGSPWTGITGRNRHSDRSTWFSYLNHRDYYASRQDPSFKKCVKLNLLYKVLLCEAIAYEFIILSASACFTAEQDWRTYCIILSYSQIVMWLIWVWAESWAFAIPSEQNILTSHNRFNDRFSSLCAVPLWQDWYLRLKL